MSPRALQNLLVLPSGSLFKIADVSDSGEIGSTTQLPDELRAFAASAKEMAEGMGVARAGEMYGMPGVEISTAIREMLFRDVLELFERHFNAVIRPRPDGDRSRVDGRFAQCITAIWEFADLPPMSRKTIDTTVRKMKRTKLRP